VTWEKEVESFKDSSGVTSTSPVPFGWDGTLTAARIRGVSSSLLLGPLLLYSNAILSLRCQNPKVSFSFSLKELYFSFLFLFMNSLFKSPFLVSISAGAANKFQSPNSPPTISSFSHKYQHFSTRNSYQRYVNSQKPHSTLLHSQQTVSFSL
jgi:hypothetical protein